MVREKSTGRKRYGGEFVERTSYEKKGEEERRVRKDGAWEEKMRKEVMK